MQLNAVELEGRRFGRSSSSYVLGESSIELVKISTYRKGCFNAHYLNVAQTIGSMDNVTDNLNMCQCCPFGFEICKFTTFCSHLPMKPMFLVA